MLTPARSSISSSPADGSRPASVAIDVEIFPAADWGVTVGRRLAAAVAEIAECRLCLPTGSTPVPAYEAFAAQGGSLATTTLFLLDEFGLPAGDPARCDAMIRRTLLDSLSAPPGALEALDPQAPDLEAECARYEATLAEGCLDLTVLGLGGNGHLGLNEPGSTIDSRTRRVDLAPQTTAHAAVYGAAQRPRWGLTVGIATILESREIWLLVTGEHKSGILRRVLTGPIGSDVPASFLRTHPNVVVLADDAAAAQMP